MDMFAGTGGSGVKSMPSEHSKVMPQKCITCHMHKQEKKDARQTEKTEVLDTSIQKGGHTFRIDDRVCLKCHDDSRALIAEWSAKTAPLIKQLKTLLANAADKNSKSYRMAKLNYGLVMADGGSGMHNPRYAEVLLRYSISSLKIGSAWEQ